MVDTEYLQMLENALEALLQNIQGRRAIQTSDGSFSSDFFLERIQENRARRANPVAQANPEQAEDAKLASIISKVDRGDPITDRELTIGIRELHRIIRYTGALGPKYALFRTDLVRKLELLEDFKQARKTL